MLYRKEHWLILRQQSSQEVELKAKEILQVALKDLHFEQLVYASF